MNVRALAPCALLLLGATEGATPPTNQVCNVRYDLVARFTYDQPIAGKPLPGLAVKGRYSGAGGSFEFFDDDGFLTLTMLMSNWQSIGVTARNLKEPVAIDRADLLLLRNVTAVGRGFFNAIVAYGAAQPDLTPDEATEVETAKATSASGIESTSKSQKACKQGGAV